MDHLPAGLDAVNAELSDVACGLTALLEDRRRTSFSPNYRLHLLKGVTQMVMMSSVSRL
jgi:hypothetical protein